MFKGFWGEIEKPIFVLAPMADVTDMAFRSIITKTSKLNVMFPTDKRVVMYTEFVSADGLCHPEGKKKLLKDLVFTESERPIVAQLFSANPEKMEKAAELVVQLGFDGLDINMGCPDRTVEKQGAGSALINTPDLAIEVIRSAYRGIKKSGKKIPLSVKTRIGYNTEELDTWLPILLKEELAVVTIHARTRREMSKVPARWEMIKKAVGLRDNLGSETFIIGNGDVKDLSDARQKVKDAGCDGAMLGRAIFGNPWLFRNLKGYIPTTEEKLKTLVEHTNLFDELISDFKSFHIMKKHFKAYVDGFQGARELRIKLMEAKNAKEVEDTVTDYLKEF